MKEIWRKYQTDSAQILMKFVVNITGICKYCHSLLCCQTSTFFNTYFRHILNFMTMMLGHLFKWQSSGQELLPSGKFCRRKTCFTRTPRELNLRQQQFRECSESVTKRTRKRDKGRKNLSRTSVVVNSFFQNHSIQWWLLLFQEITSLPKPFYESQTASSHGRIICLRHRRFSQR